MKRALHVARVMVAALTLSTAWAQSKPSFAGKWTLVPDPTAAAAAGGGRGGRGGGLGQEFTAVQTDKTLTVTTSNPQMGEMKSVYNLDGTETKNPMTFGGNTIERVSKAKWDGAKLVVTTTSNFNGNAFESTQTWSLDASGNLIVESTSNFGGNAQTTKATYKKS